MRVYLKRSVRLVLMGSALIILSLIIGCAYLDLEQPYTYHEFDGLFVYYKTQDTAAYRDLLPKEFEMPDEPLVMTFVMDYYKMDKGTQPYKEVAVLLLAKYKEKMGWYCLTMPVTSDEARIGGIKYLGFPKIMGDISFLREPTMYTGMLTLKNKTVMTVKFDPRKDNTVSKSEEAWFDKLHGIGGFNLLDGGVYEPQFGPKLNLLNISRWFPKKLVVKTGAASLIQDQEAAGAYSADMGKVFSIKPTEIVLAYYLKNSFTLSFGWGSYVN